MKKVPRVEIHFDPDDLDLGDLPAKVYEQLTDVSMDSRRIEYEGDIIIGHHINGCGDEAGREDYYVLPEDPYVPPLWLPEKCRAVLTGKVESNMTVSIKLVPAEGGYNLTVESVGEYEAATSLFEEISVGCWANP